MALDYLKQALLYENAEEQSNATEEEAETKFIACNTAGTILNICAILSKMDHHGQALEYAFEAI